MDRLRGRVRSTLRYPSRRKQKNRLSRLSSARTRTLNCHRTRSLSWETFAIEGWYDEDGEQVTSAVVVESGTVPVKTMGYPVRQ